MKLTINTKLIETLKPCKDRLDNWLVNYNVEDYSLREFLALPEITHSDKLWVILRLIDDDTRVVFALDCAFAAYDYADDYADDYAADYAANAAYYAATSAASNADAAAYAANAAYYAAYATYAYAAANAAYCAAAAASKQEQNRQLEALIYLIEGEL